MRVDPVKLIQFIVCQATEFEAWLSPIRVVISKARGQVLQSSIPKKIMMGIIPFGVIHKKVGPAIYFEFSSHHPSLSSIF